jgi:hypothetical protein
MRDVVGQMNRAGLPFTGAEDRSLIAKDFELNRFTARKNFKHVFAFF